MSGQTNGLETMPFETTSYQRPPTRDNIGSTSVPEGWQRHAHPNGDVYFYHPGMRLLTPENICNRGVLENVLDARNDYMGSLQRCRHNTLARLPDDLELTLSDVTDASAVIAMFSRRHNLAYRWTEEQGLQEKPQHAFWTHVAEYPSHHPELPPGTQAAFEDALTRAKNAVAEGVVFPFTERQIDMIIERYQHLKMAHTQGRRNALPSIGWLMGAVMPLDAVGRPYSDADLDQLMARLQL